MYSKKKSGQFTKKRIKYKSEPRQAHYSYLQKKKLILRKKRNYRLKKRSTVGYKKVASQYKTVQEVQHKSDKIQNKKPRTSKLEKVDLKCVPFVLVNIYKSANNIILNVSAPTSNHRQRTIFTLSPACFGMVKGQRKQFKSRFKLWTKLVRFLHKNKIDKIKLSFTGDPHFGKSFPKFLSARHGIRILDIISYSKIAYNGCRVEKSRRL